MSGVPYHAWTHRAKEDGGTDPIEIPSATASYPYIYREMSTDTPLTVTANSSGSGITFDNDTTATSDMQGYFAEGANPAQMTETRILGQGAGSRGVYQFTAGLHWDVPFNNPATLFIVCGAFGWAPSVSWKEPYGASGSERGDLAMVIDFRARIFTPSATTVQLQVAIDGTTNRDVQSAFLEIAYLGTFAGGDSNYTPFGFFN